MIRSVILLGIALALMATSAGASSIVTNGDFSNTTSFYDWTTHECTTGCVYPAGLNPGWNILTTSSGLPTGSGNTSGAVDGCIGANCSNTDGTGEYILQNLPTTIGQYYSLSFWYDPTGHQGGATNGTAELQAYWNGSLVTALIDETPTDWQEYTFTYLLATSTSTPLEFIGQANPGPLALTGIAVNATGPPGPESFPLSPEPASFALFGGGLLGLGAIASALRRRRKI